MPPPIPSAPFWPAAPRPSPSSDRQALAALARLVDGARAAPPRLRQVTLTDALASPVRVDGRIVGLVLPFPPDGEGPIYTPARGPGRIRELVEDGIIA